MCRAFGVHFFLAHPVHTHGHGSLNPSSFRTGLLLTINVFAWYFGYLVQFYCKSDGLETRCIIAFMYICSLNVDKYSLSIDISLLVILTTSNHCLLSYAVHEIMR